MSAQSIAARRRRLLERARRAEASNPQMSLESVEQLLPDGDVTQELRLLQARALGRLQRLNEAGEVWEEMLEHASKDGAERGELTLEALHFFLGSFDYAAIKRLLTRLDGTIPDREDALVLCIRAAQAVRQSGLALVLCERLVALAPGNPVHRCKLGSLYQSHGRMDEAEQAFVKSLSVDPNFQPAWYFLAQLKKWQPGSDHLLELNSFLQRQGAADKDTSAAYYALAKELEDLGRYEESFQHLQSGAKQIRDRSSYSSELDRKLFRELKEWFLKSEASSDGGMALPGPVFILGMPRTGSTLTDRILASHSEVESVGELLCFRRAVEELCGGRGKSDFFASFFSEAPFALPYKEIGARYLEMLAPLTGSDRYFIDKMPMNYFFVGLIARALPGARFIHTKRNPLDTCFSNYKQMFGEGYYGYSYDLEELAQHYTLYCELMAFWHQQLPGQIYDLEYEELVAEPELEVRKLLEWLTLPWEPECLEFHLNKSAVNTASVSQVRQPIYRGSVEKWRKFSEQLKPLQEALDAL